MISPHTKPGTEVVCLYWPKHYAFLFPHQELREGAIYTVRRIAEHPLRPGKFGVHLGEVVNAHAVAGVECAYQLEMFRYLDLAGLDALLTAPAPAELAEA